MLQKAASVGIMPWQFWRLTYLEFCCVCVGHIMQMKELQQLEAWSCSTLMSVWMKEGERVTPSQLLGSAPETRPIQDAESFRARMRAKKARERGEDI